jgi:hypothetical protein
MQDLSTVAVTLLFVHGTGVRHKGYERNLEAIRAGCAANGFGDLVVCGCPWGERVGITTELIESTLPPMATRAAVEGPPTPKDEEAALWQTLLEDPLFELRLAGDSADAESGSGYAIGEQPQEQALIDRVSSLGGRTGERDLANAGITAGELSEAASAVAQSEELAAASRSARTDPTATPDELADTVARAIVATVLAEYALAPPGEAPDVYYDAACRNDLVVGIAAILEPDSTRGLGSWLGKKVANFAARRATSAFAARRNRMTVGSLPFLGDILYYEKRGDAIRGVVVDAIKQAPQPVVALGHSLGGIILVDILSGPEAPPVDRLVTVGSQSPLFYAIDALDRIRRLVKGADPAPFTPWLNIYDRSDFLSFVAAKVFPGVAVTDHEIASGVPFPASHSAYFHQQETFEAIKGFLQ